MKFLDKLNKQWSLLDEADNIPAPAPTQAPVQSAIPDVPQDATTPDLNATPTEDEPTQVAPEGYVGLVKLLAKATAMNFPAGALDEIFRTEITAENAFPVQTALEAAIKQNEMYSDNPERLDNIHVKQFIDSINTGNFIKKYKQLLAVMHERNPYLKDANL